MNAHDAERFPAQPIEVLRPIHNRTLEVRGSIPYTPPGNRNGLQRCRPFLVFGTGSNRSLILEVPFESAVLREESFPSSTATGGAAMEATVTLGL